MRTRDGRPVTIRLRFGDDARLGPGKIALLEALERSRSLEEAGRSLGMSARRATLLIESVSAIFDGPVIEASDDASGLRLTALGRELVRVFRAVERDVERSVDKRFAALRAQMRVAPASDTDRIADDVPSRPGANCG